MKAPHPPLGVYAGLVHTGGGVGGDPMSDAQSTGAKWGYIAGIPLGWIAGKTILGAHPIIFGAGLIVVSGWLVVRSLFTTCTIGMLGGDCYDNKGQQVACNDPTALSSCKRDGAFTGTMSGAGLGSIIAGSTLGGIVLAGIILGLFAYDRYEQSSAQVTTDAPTSLDLGAYWSTNYKGYAVQIQNVNGAYVLTIFNAPTGAGGSPVYQGTYGSSQEAWGQAMEAIDTAPLPAAPAAAYPVAAA